MIRLRGSCREQGTADHRNSGQELTQSDAEVRPVAASNPSPSRKAHHYGLGEAARSWGGSAVLGRQRGLGGFPHERLPWFPRGKQRCGRRFRTQPLPMSDCRGFPHSLLHQEHY
ncbi:MULTISPECIES: hypothetical protein [Moorena]|uniref:hypothetical protein n=1 Tax=Moorena TaxID=1155738 RepID=UPI001054B7F7|nr:MULTISPECIES: hypothetical protein [Moorena]NEP33010.1 hypothetical protein [Moorena sp. SIO3B2]NEP68746.1 hypothetical protein [Moorena sp. SIO3A5]NEQ14745.1 hypothetical protein [Moorena sp. SIO3E2]